MESLLGFIIDGLRTAIIHFLPLWLDRFQVLIRYEQFHPHVITRVICIRGSSYFLSPILFLKISLRGLISQGISEWLDIAVPSRSWSAPSVGNQIRQMPDARCQMPDARCLIEIQIIADLSDDFLQSGTTRSGHFIVCCYFRRLFNTFRPGKSALLNLHQVNRRLSIVGMKDFPDKRSDQIRSETSSKEIV